MNLKTDVGDGTNWTQRLHLKGGCNSKTLWDIDLKY